MRLALNRYRFILLTVLIVLITNIIADGQAVPGKDENIPFLMTFGKDGKTSWGDDDF
jgi:hypothetical protein